MTGKCGTTIGAADDCFSCFPKEPTLDLSRLPASSETRDDVGRRRMKQLQIAENRPMLIRILLINTQNGYLKAAVNKAEQGPNNWANCLFNG